MSGPLQQWLDSLLVNVGRTKRKAERINLEWTLELETCFKDVKALIQNAVLQYHPDPEAELCLFADANDHYWG